MNMIAIILSAVLAALLPASVEYYKYAEELEKSEAYSVSVSGKDVAVIPTDQAHIAQFGTDGEVLVEISVKSDDVRSVDIRPISKGYEYELEGNVIKVRLKTGDKVSVEVNDNLEDPLFIFVNPLEGLSSEEAQQNDDILFFPAGTVSSLSGKSIKKYKGLYIEGGAVVKGPLVCQTLSGFKIAGNGFLDSREVAGNGSRFVDCTKMDISGICILNSSMYGALFVNCNALTINNAKVINQRTEKIANEKSAFDFAACSGVSCRGLFAYSQANAIHIHNKYSETAFPVSDISFSDCIAWNAITGSTLRINGSDDLAISGLKVEDFYAIHSAGDPKKAYHRASLSINQSGGKAISGLSFKNFVAEDPREFFLSINGYVSGLEFNGLTSMKKPYFGSEIKGTDFDHRVENVVFEKFFIEDKQVLSLKQASFKVTVMGLNISFKK